MDRPADHLIRKIESPELRNQGQELFGFLLSPVLSAPFLKSFLCLLLRDPEGNDALRHVFRIQVFGPYQAATAERASRESFILLKHYFRAAAAAGCAEKTVLPDGVSEFLPLQFPKSLFFLLCFADTDCAAAVTAHVHLLHDVENGRCSALRAVNVCDFVFHVRCLLFDNRPPG